MKNKITWKHKIGKRNRAIVVIGVSGNTTVSAITLSGAKVPISSQKISWDLNYKFPFIHKRYTALGVKTVSYKP